MPSVGPIDVLIVLLIAALWVGVVGLTIYGALVLIGRVRGRSGGPTLSADDRAVATLRDRFARGEIDEAEYRRLRYVLRGR